MNTSNENNSNKFFEDHLQRYLDGELDPSTRQLVASELRENAEFRALKDELEQEQLDLVNSLVVTPKLSSRFASKVIDRIQAESDYVIENDGFEEDEYAFAEAQEEPVQNASSKSIIKINRLAAGFAAAVAIAVIFTLNSNFWNNSTDDTNSSLTHLENSTLQNPAVSETQNPNPVVEETIEVAIVTEDSNEETGTSNSQDLNLNPIATIHDMDDGGPPLPAQLSDQLVHQAIDSVKQALGTTDNPCTDDLNQDASTNTLDIATVVIANLTSDHLPPGVSREFDCSRIQCESY